MFLNLTKTILENIFANSFKKRNQKAIFNKVKIGAEGEEYSPCKLSRQYVIPLQGVDLIMVPIGRSKMWYSMSVNYPADGAGGAFRTA